MASKHRVQCADCQTKTKLAYPLIRTPKGKVLHVCLICILHFEYAEFCPSIPDLVG
jgi:hypothetical protein